MHIFLTGKVQIGKSTVVDKTIKILEDKLGIPITPGGFRTISCERDATGRSEVFLVAAPQHGEVSLCAKESRIAVRSLEHPAPQSFPHVFDQKGCEILEESRKAPMILMDELGFIESQAPLFQRAVLGCLENGPLIFGVLREKNIAFLNQVRQHPKVEVIAVTKDNRNGLPAIIAEKLFNEMGGSV